MIDKKACRMNGEVRVVIHELQIADEKRAVYYDTRDVSRRPMIRERRRPTSTHSDYAP